MSEESDTLETVKDVIADFMSDNLHIVLEEDGEQAEIPKQKFISDLAAKIQSMLKEARIAELASMYWAVGTVRLHQDGYYDAQEAIRVRMDELNPDKELKS